MSGQFLRYDDDGYALEGYLAGSPEHADLPGVLLLPTWMNVEPNICRQADHFAALGYTAFVADLLGRGRRPGPPEDPLQVISPYLTDRLLFRRRLLAALAALIGTRSCNRRKIAAVGYCFGGCGALELARMNADIVAAISVHGLLANEPSLLEQSAINVPILALHGALDPVVPWEQVENLREEMQRRNGNWQLHVYGNATHGFSGLSAVARKGVGSSGQDFAMASWIATQNFLHSYLSSHQAL